MIPSPSPNTALVLRVPVVFESVLVELILAKFFNVEDAMSCKLPYHTGSNILRIAFYLLT